MSELPAQSQTQGTDQTPTGYDVVLLVEQALTALDARQVRSLHEEIEQPVRYHLLMPVENAAEQVESAMGALAGGEMISAALPVIDPDELDEIQKELLESARADVAASVKTITDAGGIAEGRLVTTDPIDALVETVAKVDAAEAIILTRPHVIAELFHLDWTSRARRKLGVPVLHLLEHETFDEQAGQGEGVSGL
ncbi:MAG: hypothetical protein HZY75_10885 [Nocardioidaceae bacterium]|nr:MAG: hypothetical protein HZY75_10885 [Nocardioidaceae bacterium]